MIILPLTKTLGATVFAGASQGRLALTTLQRALQPLPLGFPVVIDLEGVEVLAASYFREALWPLSQWCLEHGGTLIVANANTAVLDDIGIALDASGGVIVSARLRGDKLSHPRVFGHLDEKLLVTLNLVCRVGRADARTIAEASGESTVVTAWNNRLVNLTRMGLLREDKQGKTKFYSPALKGLNHGY